MGVGCLTSPVALASHPSTSVTVTLYTPALRLVAVEVDAPLDQVNEVGNGMVVVTVADPVESP